MPSADSAIFDKFIILLAFQRWCGSTQLVVFEDRDVGGHVRSSLRSSVRTQTMVLWSCWAVWIYFRPVVVVHWEEDGVDCGFYVGHEGVDGAVKTLNVTCFINRCFCTIITKPLKLHAQIFGGAFKWNDETFG
jgi:hypothetical protein